MKVYTPQNDQVNSSVVLLEDEKSLPAGEREAANRVAQALLHDGLARRAATEEKLQALLASGGPGRFEAVGTLLDYMESAPDLFDADRLAFRELLRSLQQAAARDGALPAIKLHKRIGEDLDALVEMHDVGTPVLVAHRRGHAATTAYDQGVRLSAPARVGLAGKAG